MVRPRAKLELDKENHIISFKTKGLNISYGCSPMIKSIISVENYDCGYMVIQSNLGEDYIDLLVMLEVEGYEPGYISYAEKILGSIKLSEIKVINN